MDLSKLEDADLEAIAAGDMSKVSDAGLQYLSGEPAQQKRGFFPSSFRELGSDVMGGIEGAANVVTGGIGGLGGGLTYLGTLAATGGDTEAARAVQESTQEAFTYRPRSQSGQEGAANIGNILGYIPRAADRAGEAVSRGTGSPMAGAVTNTAIQALPNLVSAKGARRVGNDIADSAAEAAAKYRPGFKRTPEAQRLIDQGVDLTPGQMNPTGVMSAFEQLPIKAHVPLLGGVMFDARSNARLSWQKQVAESAAAPGTKIKSNDINGMADEAFDSFGPLYDQAKGHPVSPVIRKVTEAEGTTTVETVPLRKAFADAIKDKSIQADPATRNSTGVWLMNKLGSLQRKPGTPGLDSAQLIDLRSDIRAQIRLNAKARDAGKNDSAQLLQGAERAITESLESQLPKSALDALKAADSKYGDYKVFEAAVSKAKDNPAGFSPENLAQAIKDATGESAYARGGGRMRQNAKDAKATLTDGMPATGAIVPAAAGMTALAVKAPLFAAPVAGAGVLLSSTKTGRRFARGQTTLQQWLQTAAQEASKKR